jgi:hypothetical protein
LQNLNITFTIDAVTGGITLQRYPGFLKAFVSPSQSMVFVLSHTVLINSIVRQFLTNVPACMARAERHLGPLVRERLAKEKEHGSSDWPDKPVRMVSLFKSPTTILNWFLLAE